jgi:hypothetical protein
MKIIFLDIDGVLNVVSQGHDEFGSLFHSHFEDNLKYIIEKTNAKIVISSSWRMSGLEVIKEMWNKRNLPGEIIDITPDCSIVVNNSKEEFKFYDDISRGQEIQYWLDNHSKIDSYCIIDDDSDILESQLPYFVQTSNNITHPDCIDIGYGLTKICSDKVIEILNKKC